MGYPSLLSSWLVFIRKRVDTAVCAMESMLELVRGVGPSASFKLVNPPRSFRHFRTDQSAWIFLLDKMLDYTKYLVSGLLDVIIGTFLL